MPPLSAGQPLASEILPRLWNTSNPELEQPEAEKTR